MNIVVTNTSTWNYIPGSTPVTRVYWGDNSISLLPHQNGSTVSHTYTAPGNFVISMGSVYYDSLNNAPYCTDTAFTIVNVSTSPCLTHASAAYAGGGAYVFLATNLGGGSVDPFW